MKNPAEAWKASNEPYHSITVVPTFEGAFDLDTFTICIMSKDSERRIWHRKLERAFNFVNNRICMFLGKDGEYRTECRKLQCRHWLVELCGPPQQMKLHQHLVLEGTRRLEGRMVCGTPWQTGKTKCSSEEVLSSFQHLNKSRFASTWYVKEHHIKKK